MSDYKERYQKAIQQAIQRDYIHDVERLEILQDLCKEHNIKLSDLLMHQIVQRLEDISYHLNKEE